MKNLDLSLRLKSATTSMITQNFKRMNADSLIRMRPVTEEVMETEDQAMAIAVAEMEVEVEVVAAAALMRIQTTFLMVKASSQVQQLDM